MLQQALALDWTSASVRSMEGPLPPVAISVAGLPLVERIRFKVIEDEQQLVLELQAQSTDLRSIDDEFWDAFDALDRQALYESTVALLEQSGTRMGIAELVQHLPPTHDLETIALWLSMAREAGVSMDNDRESVDVVGRDGVLLRFNVPLVALSFEDLRGLGMEL